MTCIAWDGKTLAADKQAQWGSWKHPVTKIRRLADGTLAGGSGELVFVLAMLKWLENGAKNEEFPKDQRDKDDWQPVLHVDRAGVARIYERTPFPVLVESTFLAIGSGRDYALAAMHCGRNARQAVEVACHFDSGCGLGIDTLTLVE